MGQLINGKWYDRQALAADEHTGEFQRKPTTFRNRVENNPDADFPLEADRYHLYICRACPWAHRTAILRQVKGLTEAVSLSLVEPVRIDQGWEFSDQYPDPHYGAQYLRELYVKADPEFTGRVTVPVLWDTKTDTIVNNESREIMRMLDTVFDPLAEKDVTFLPSELQEQVDRVIDEIYDPINNGVYRAGFAGTQHAHERAVRELFAALDHWENVLSDQPYLCGDQLTEADWCMFTTLYRFDQVYHTHFKCNVRRIADYPSLQDYLKRLYNVPGVKETCNMQHIKDHYYKSHTWLNPTQLVPIGPEMDLEE